MPVALVFCTVPVVSGFRLTTRAPWNWLGFGGQSRVVPRVPDAVHACPLRAPALQRPFTHFGHAEATLPVRYTREESGIDVEISPVVRSIVPLASLAITLTTQTLSPPWPGAVLGIGSGGAKKQFASRAQAPPWLAHWASVVHTWFVKAPPMQCFPGPAPRVQLSGPFPALATRLPPLIPKIVVEASGRAAGGTLALPPPVMRQPRPRSTILVVHPSSESS